MSVTVHTFASLLAGAARLISGCTVRWVDCRPEGRQRIYFANHTSHLDFVVLWSCLPRKIRTHTRPVAAQDYWEKSQLRRFLATRIFDAVLIPRGEVAEDSAPGAPIAAAKIAIERVASAIGDRYSVILFPEGTRGTGKKVADFKSGLYHLCQQKPGIELVPVYIDNLNRILPKGEFLPVPFVSQLTFGPPMRLIAGEAKRDFLARARESVCRLHGL